MRVRAGCALAFDSTEPAPLQIVVRPASWSGQILMDEVRQTVPDIPIHQYWDSYGNAVWRLVAPSGTLRLRYDAILDLPRTADPVLPDLPKARVEDLPDDLLAYLLPSRYCPSDQFFDEAWRRFGDIQGGWAQVQAICDWIHAEITYAQTTNSGTSAWEVFHERRGVCRDFAHLGVTFCRALGIPARYVCGYLPDIDVEPDPNPRDFHAYFEAYIGGAWWTFDARHNRPRIGRVLIGRGRDAADVALATIYGPGRLDRIVVWADEVADNLALPRMPATEALTLSGV